MKKLLLFLMSILVSGMLFSQIIPPLGATSSYTLTPGQTTNFYDPSGPGGNPCGTGPVPQGNYSNCNCFTITTISAAVGEYLFISFNEFSMWNTTSGWDWMTIHDGTSIAAPIIYDNRAGGPDNPFGDCGIGTTILDFCSSGRSLTFRFWATSVVNRAGWDATVSSNPGNCTLPVELEFFTGENKGNYNLLSWVTASEINNSHFIVERSRGGEFWEYLETIPGNGNTNTPSMYEYKDYEYIDGVNYYRLIQVDFDGATDISNIVAISTIERPKQEKPKAYDTLGREIPNPSSYIGIIIYKYSNGFWYKVSRLRNN